MKRHQRKTLKETEDRIAKLPKAILSNILLTASQHPAMVCKSQDFGRHPFLLNCQKGVLTRRYANPK